jgi:hypothetical protein
LKIADLRTAGAVRPALEKILTQKRVEDNQAYVKKKLLILYSAGVKLGLPL